MVPYFSYLQYTDSEYQGSTGTIMGVQSLDGEGTVTATWTGPNGYTAGPFTMPTHPDLTNLEPGVYTGTIIDSNLDKTTLDITIGELLEVILTTTDTDLCNCSSCDGSIRVLDFIHNSECFTYNLYDSDNILVDSYSTCGGSVDYVFTNLCIGQYHLEAVETDCVIYTYSNPDNCDQGDVVIDGAVDVEIVVENWRRFALSNNVIDAFFNFPSTVPQKAGNIGDPILTINGGGWSGLLQDGSIAYNDNRAYFYIGDAPLTPLTAPAIPAPTQYPQPPAYYGSTTTRYLGAFAAGPDDGTNYASGGPGQPPTPTVYLRQFFFYNTDTNKFIYCKDILGVSQAISIWTWITFDAKDEILVSNPLLPPDPHVAWPNGSDFYTTDSQWDVAATTPRDITMDPAGNVLEASSLPVPVNKKIQGYTNSVLKNGFFSDCKFLNYTHEITIGGEYIPPNREDDDSVSIILARHVDDNGYTHLLTLDFSLAKAGIAIPAIRVNYNNSGLNSQNTMSNLTFNNGLEAYDPEYLIQDYIINKDIYKQIPIPNPLTNIPFLEGGPTYTWSEAGKIRVKITRSGLQGESFFIEMTDTMGVPTTQATLNPGDVVATPYNPDYTFSFNITDATTWSDKPAFLTDPVLENTLSIFLGPTNYGYAAYSQDQSEFYHINFEGEQTNITDGREPCEVIEKYDTEPCSIYELTACDLGEACDVVPRLGEPGFSTKNCDPNQVIKVKTKFADSVYAHFKRTRYGIETCCEFDLDKIDIKNQLIDLGELYDPELCVDGNPISEDCCLQPCNAVAALITPQAIACEPPVNAITTIVWPQPPLSPCVFATFSVNINNARPFIVTGTDCCGEPFSIDVVINQPVSLCIDRNAQLTVETGVVYTLGNECDCCPAPTDVTTVVSIIPAEQCMQMIWGGDSCDPLPCPGTVSGKLCCGEDFSYTLTGSDDFTPILCVIPSTVEKTIEIQLISSFGPCDCLN